MDKIRELLKLLPHHLQVSFALYCAIDAKVHLTPGSNREVKASFAINLTKKWLKDSSSVSKQELRDAADAAADAADADAAYAAYAAYAANAANAAAYAAAAAAAAAADAANAAAYAAAAAAAAAADAAARGKKLKQYESELRRMIEEMSKLEQVIYKLENQ